MENFPKFACILMLHHYVISVIVDVNPNPIVANPRRAAKLLDLSEEPSPEKAAEKVVESGKSSRATRDRNPAKW